MTLRIEETLAKGVGVARAAQAHLTGLHGVFITLAEQHAEVALLLKRAAVAEGPKQQDLWHKIRAELLSHEKAELDEIYPVLHQHSRLQEAVHRHELDAPRLESAIAQVDACAFGTHDWSEALHVLQHLVEKHAEQEEQEYFPLALEVIDKPLAKALDGRFSAAKEAYMRRYFGSD